jgi:hypothetical protein
MNTIYLIRCNGSPVEVSLSKREADKRADALAKRLRLYTKVTPIKLMDRQDIHMWSE